MTFSYTILGLFLFSMLASCLLGYTPAGIAVIFIGFSVATYIAYAKDKRAAINGEWRVSEGSLHLMALLCGWPGAVVAQQKLRHKTRKVSFLAVFWLTVAVNVAAFAWLHFPGGSSQLSKVANGFERVVSAQVTSESFKNLLLSLTAYRRRS